MSFKNKFKKYKNCMEPGVILPKIKVQQKKLNKLGVKS